MRERAKAVRDRQAQGNFTKSWSLSGKNAIVEPGQVVTVRYTPRWDYANSVVTDSKTNQRVPNPAYKFDQPPYVVGYEHWWDIEGGKTTREWCPRTLDPEADCIICQSATVLMASGTKEDRDFGKRIQAREVFVFNAVVGDPRKVAQDGSADIRILSCPGTVFNAVSDIMTGGDNAQFARGDITHPREGYDLAFRRPVGGGGDRWTVQVAPQPTPLYGPAQAAAFKGWVTKLVDLEDMLQKETKDSVAIFRAYYGRDPEPGEVKGAPVAQDEPIGYSAAQQGQQQPPSAEPPVGPDDEFMPPPPSAQRGPARPAPVSQTEESGIRRPGVNPVARPKIAPRAPRR